MSASQYFRFLIVGTVVAAMTIGARELFAMALQGDNARNYSISVIAAYAIGILLGFFFNKKFTFQNTRTSNWKICQYAIVAVVGMMTTWIAAYFLRYRTELPGLFGKYDASAAFAAAALLSSCITYPLNALLIFKSERR